jgi:shikimate dehydrogenase
MKRLAILGSPIRQAMSPVLHRAAYHALGLEWTYEAINCTPGRLPGFLADADDTWAGFSLTMPLKRAVIPLLDTVTPVVEATGTANTITVQAGKLLGDNTDVHGMLTALTETGLARAGTATILGTGATACTALAAVQALGCPTITVVARSPDRTAPLRDAAARLRLNVEIVPWQEAAHYLAADVVISALPPGAADRLAPLWRPADNLLLDVVYRPLSTIITQAARTQGSTVVSGLPMLLHQAARQVELQTGRTPAPIQAMQQAALRQL